MEIKDAFFQDSVYEMFNNFSIPAEDRLMGVAQIYQSLIKGLYFFSNYAGDPEGIKKEMKNLYEWEFFDPFLGATFGGYKLEFTSDKVFPYLRNSFSQDRLSLANEEKLIFTFPLANSEKGLVLVSYSRIHPEMGNRTSYTVMVGFDK